MSERSGCSRGNFAPAGWMFCEGQLLPISENETLFQLIGTTYGGDGRVTFALPDLRGRLPIHQGNGFILAETGGAEEITLTVQSDSGAQPSAAGVDAARRTRHDPPGNVAGRDRGDQIYLRRHAADAQHGAAVRSARSGGSQPHTNFQPYLCVDFIISLFGIFPSRPET